MISLLAFTFCLISPQTRPQSSQLSTKRTNSFNDWNLTFRHTECSLCEPSSLTSSFLPKLLPHLPTYLNWVWNHFPSWPVILSELQNNRVRPLHQLRTQVLIPQINLKPSRLWIPWLQVPYLSFRWMIFLFPWRK